MLSIEDAKYSGASSAVSLHSAASRPITVFPASPVVQNEHQEHIKFAATAEHTFDHGCQHPQTYLIGCCRTRMSAACFGCPSVQRPSDMNFMLS